jgi:hypothetical protein
VFATTLWCSLAAPSIGGQPHNSRSADDEQLFWTIWAQLGDAAELCKSETNARIYLETVEMVVSDATKARLFSETVESMAIDWPVCLLNAIVAMQARKRKTIVEQFLTKPRVHRPQDIEASLSRYWNDGRYIQIRQLYIGSRK